MATLLTPSSEQVLLTDTLRRWAELQDPREQEPFAETWQHFAEMGLFGAGFSEEAGGFGGNAFDTALIAIELGRQLIKAPYVEVAGAATQLILDLCPEQTEQIVEGSMVPLLAHDEADAWGDRQWVKTSAEESGGQWRLSGTKTGLVGCANATRYLVSASTHEGEIRLFDVPADQASVRHYTTIDNRPGGELHLQNTEATPLPNPELHKAAINRALDYALVMESAEAIGAMCKALDITRDYLKERKQFGVALSTFQALQHRLADMFIQSEQAYSILLRAIDSLLSGKPTERKRNALAAKVLVAKAGDFVTANAIQLHGGIGVTNEHSIGHYYKRASAFSLRHGGRDSALDQYTAGQ